MQACGCGCPVAPSSSSSSTATVPSALVKGLTPRATLSGTLYMYLSCGHFVVCWLTVFQNFTLIFVKDFSVSMKAWHDYAFYTSQVLSISI